MSKATCWTCDKRLSMFSPRTLRSYGEKWFCDDFCVNSYLISPSQETIKETSPLEKQEAGSHYKDMKIQPVEYCHANKLGICESNIIKYISRYKNKNGLQDLKKAKHMIELLIELEYGSEKRETD